MKNVFSLSLDDLKTLPFIFCPRRLRERPKERRRKPFRPRKKKSGFNERIADKVDVAQGDAAGRFGVGGRCPLERAQGGLFAPPPPPPPGFKVRQV